MVADNEMISCSYIRFIWLRIWFDLIRFDSIWLGIIKGGALVLCGIALQAHEGELPPIGADAWTVGQSLLQQ